MTEVQILALLSSVLDFAESKGSEPEALFGAAAKLFGEAMTRYVDPGAVPGFLRQEALRVEAMLGQGETRQ